MEEMKVEEMERAAWREGVEGPWGQTVHEAPVKRRLRRAPVGIPDPQLDLGGHRGGAGRGLGCRMTPALLTTPPPGSLTLSRGVMLFSTRRAAATSSPVTKGGQPLGRRADPKENQRISEREKMGACPSP